MSSIHQSFGRGVPAATSIASSSFQGPHDGQDYHLQRQRSPQSSGVTFGPSGSRSREDAPVSSSPYLGESAGSFHPSSGLIAANQSHPPGLAEPSRPHPQSPTSKTSDARNNTLPRIDLSNASGTASSSSSPYQSPRLPPRSRQGGIGSMGDITLPPLSSAVPMRRGAVSGESSGPSLPFPPMRLPYNDEDIPSRGPSPSMGRRPSFTVGHSRHVPPGPAVQLPTPALAGSPDRRQAAVPAQQGIAGFSDVSRTGAIRLSDDGTGYYYASSNAGASARPNGYPQEPVDEGSYMALHASYQQSGPQANYGRPSEDSYYAQGTSAHPPSYGIPANAQATKFPAVYARYGQGEGGPQMGTMILGQSQNEGLMAMNGKRPRSAPRVLSSQPRIFACTQCPARFARNHDLKRHQRGHLSVRPYPCTWCGKSFSRKDALKRHVLVKGCGKESKNGGGGGSSDDSQSKKRSRSGDDGTEPSGYDFDGDDDDEDDGSYMQQEASDDEDHADRAYASHAEQHQHATTHKSVSATHTQMGDNDKSRYMRSPNPAETPQMRWPPTSVGPFGSTNLSAGGRLSISGLSNFALNGVGSSFYAPAPGPAAPSYRGGDGLLSDIGFASSRRPSAVA